MTKSNKNIKLGAFVILIALIFTFGVYRVSGGKGLLNNTLTIYAEFDNVEGLLTGNNVRYSGVKVGTVTSIDVKSYDRLVVTMSLDEGVSQYMKNNAQADISTNGLVGNMLINITPGSGDAPMIQDEDYIMKKESTELSDMLNTLSTTNEKISQITESLLQITDKINNGSGTISQLINDGSLADNLEASTRNIAKASSHIRTSTDSINRMVANVFEGNGNLGYLLKDNSLKGQISQISDNLDSLINDRTAPIIGNLEISTSNIAQTSQRLDSIINDLSTNEGLIGALLNDTMVSNDLKNTIENLNSGTQKFDESMEALQHHWLLRGFFKKKEKEAKKAQEKKDKN